MKKNTKILVVDDEQDILELIRHSLNKEGYEVYVAANGQQGVDKARKVKRVLPVGGIREKILAAKRSGITHILLCADSRKDIDEIPARYLKGLKIDYVTEMAEVIALAVTPQKVKDAKDLRAKA